MEIQKLAENSGWLGEEWQKWSESLKIEVDPKTHQLLANTPEGRIPVISFFSMGYQLLVTLMKKMNL